MSFPDDLPIGERCENCGEFDFDCECVSDQRECPACDGVGLVFDLSRDGTCCWRCGGNGLIENYDHA